MSKKGKDNEPVNFIQQKTFVSSSNLASVNEHLMGLIRDVSPMNPSGMPKSNAYRENLYISFWYRSGLFKYQENPVLLDPILPGLFDSLFTNLMAFKIDETGRIGDIDEYLIQARYVVYLMHTRKCKKVDKYFPHEVHHLRLILNQLDGIRLFEKDFNKFIADGEYTRENSPDMIRMGLKDSILMLMGWLSSLMRIPFSFEKINPTFRQKVIDLCKENIYQSGTTGYMACMCLARYYSRSDSKLDDNISDILGNLSNGFTEKEFSMKNLLSMIGGLKFLCYLYKVGDKVLLRTISEEVYGVVQKISEIYDEIDDDMKKDSLIQKLLTKLAGRIAMTELKPRQAKWKYNRGSRILGVKRVEAIIDDEEEDEEEEVEVSEIVESVLSILINCLSDNATIVRWNAAKHLGRVTERLDAENASLILGEIINLLDDTNAESSWHGGCSALAEFSRRNMITSEHIEISISKIRQGLCYDKRRGEGSVGSNVRDAACYASWTFARGFHPTHIRDYIQTSVRTLITTACFDKEVSCRKAAQSALQENIGRLPLEFIPNGLDINQLLNFQTIAQLHSAAKVGGEIVVQFPEYREGIINYLMTNRCIHWEFDVRQAASKAIASTLEDPECLEMFRHRLPGLLEQGLTENNDYILHGAVMTLASTFNHFIDKEPEALGKIQNILDYLINSKHFSDPATFSYVIRPSILDLLKVYAKEASKVKDYSKFVSWIDLIQNSVMKMGQLPDQLVELGLRGLCQSITPAIELLIVALPEDEQRKICGRLISQVKSQKATALESARICACYLIKSYKVVTEAQTLELLHLTTEGSRLDSKSNPVRHYFVHLRAEILQYVLDVLWKEDVSDEILQILGKTILLTFDDYARNQRGDIGSHVRLAALKAVQQISSQLHRLDISIILEIFSKTLQQGAEKILNIREEAARTLIVLETHSKLHEDISDLYSIFKKVEKSRYHGFCTMSRLSHSVWVPMWGAEKMFPIYTKILKLKSFQKCVLQGMIVSGGDLTQSLSEKALKASNEFLDDCTEEELDSVLIHIRDLFNGNPILLAKPMLKILDEFLARGLFEDVEESKVLAEIFDLCNKYTRAKDSQSAINAISCLVGYSRMDEYYERCLKRFQQLLYNKKPYIRYQTAEKILQNYEILSITHDIPATVAQLLRDTDWIDDKQPNEFFKETARQIISDML